MVMSHLSPHYVFALIFEVLSDQLVTTLVGSEVWV